MIGNIVIVLSILGNILGNLIIVVAVVVAVVLLLSVMLVIKWYKKPIHGRALVRSGSSSAASWPRPATGPSDPDPTDSRVRSAGEGRR